MFNRDDGLPPQYDSWDDYPIQGDAGDALYRAGAASWSDIIVNMGDDLNPDHYRPGLYSTPEEALYAYDDQGIGHLITIYYDVFNEMYAVYVGDSTGI